ncbi:MAG: 50S ribosomal protein L15 [Pseudomonadota bacterium]
MNLSDLSGPPTRRKSRRVGRGESSGVGKTCGKGHKGQKSRSGGKVAPGFEGGQMPLQRRLPKKGFKNPFRIRYNVINLRDLSRVETETEITSGLLRDKGIVKRRGPVKLLSNGEVTSAYTIKLDRVSSGARAKIEAAGGSVVDS